VNNLYILPFLDNVDTFLRTLQTHQLPTCQSELSVLQQMLQKNANSSSTPTVNAWDRDFAMQLFSTEQRRKSTDMSAFLPNFSVGSVIQGLSRLFKNLYGVEFEPSELKPGESWHDQVRKLDVVCEKEGKIGTIYCDLFSRAGKTTNAAHYTIRTSRRLNDDDAENDVHFAFPNKDMSSYQLYPPLTHCGNTIRGQEGLFQLPVIALTCDFSGSKNQSMLSMSEIETLFHEMGHAMHSMLGRTDFHNVAGTRCATDFVELPSILMEHFVLHPQVLPLFSNQPVSDASVRYYQSQRKQFSGIEVNSQILMALLDQRYHSTEVLKPDFSSSTSWYQLQDEVGLFPSVPGTMWPVQFGHLFGYGANYYSYLFDRTLAKKIWDSSFKENPLDREKGQAFRENLLKWGGARDPWKCIASVLGDKDGELIAHGDERAMRTVGDWGIDV
jgi:intermediate peptidase